MGKRGKRRLRGGKAPASGDVGADSGPRRAGELRATRGLSSALPQPSTHAGLGADHHPGQPRYGAGAVTLDHEGLNAKVLVLNKMYVAVRVVTARRAFVLLSRDVAEVIHADDGSYANYDFETWSELSELREGFEVDHHDWVRTVRFDIAVPKIIRLLGYDKLPRQGVKLNRRNLFARDRNRCQYCGQFFPTSELSIDHVMPRSQGGGDSWENLVCSCVRCNARKGGRTPHQASMKLIRKPAQPRRNPLITARLGHDKYRSWKAFLDEAYWSVELG